MNRGRLVIGSLAALAVLAFASTAVAHSVVRIKGTMKDDVLTGTPGHDLVHARAGNDTVNAGDGNDRVHGMRGDDTLNGDGGNDRLLGDHGKDTENGGDGDDRLHALARDNQKDTLDCGPGNDIVWLNAAG